MLNVFYIINEINIILSKIFQYKKI